MDRQLIHPRGNRNIATPRVQFRILSWTTSTPLDLPSIIIQSTPPPTGTISQSNLYHASEYLGSTPSNKQIRENPFNPPPPQIDSPFERIVHLLRRSKPCVWTKRNIPRYNLVITGNTFFHQDLRWQVKTITTISTKFPNQLNDRFQEFLNNTEMTQHWDDSRLHNWAMNRLQNTHDIHKDIQEHKIQKLSQQGLVLKN